MAEDESLKAYLRMHASAQGAYRLVRYQADIFMETGASDFEYHTLNLRLPDGIFDRADVAAIQEISGQGLIGYSAFKEMAFRQKGPSVTANALQFQTRFFAGHPFDNLRAKVAGDFTAEITPSFLTQYLTLVRSSQGGPEDILFQPGLGKTILVEVREARINLAQNPAVSRIIREWTKTSRAGEPPVWA